MFVMFLFVDMKDFWRENDAIHHTSKFKMINNTRAWDKEKTESPNGKEPKSVLYLFIRGIQ